MRLSNLRQGFTLIEMAVVLIIIGVILTLTLPLVGEKLAQDKLAKSRGSVNSLKQEIIGYAIANKHLPTESMVEGFANAKDAQQNYIAYYVDPTLASGDICNLASTNYKLAIGSPATATYSNLAFILASRGANQNLEINADAANPTARTVTTYPQGTQGIDVYNTPDPTGTTKGPYDVPAVETNLHFDDLVEYVALEALQSKIGCSDSACPIGAPVGFDNIAQDFAKVGQNFSSTTGGSGVLNITATTLDLGNGETNAAACIWSNATVPDANRDGIWDGTVAVGQLSGEHFVCRSNGAATPVVYCYGYNHTTNPGTDPVANMTPWTKVAAVFKFSALNPDTAEGSTSYEGGFVFALIAANGNGDGTPCSGDADNCGSTAPCSNENAGLGNRGPYMGWSDSSPLSHTNYMRTPKIGVEVDFYPEVADRNDPNVGSGAPICGQTSNTFANHVASVYYVNSGAGVQASSSNDNRHNVAIIGATGTNPTYAAEGTATDCSQDSATGPNGFATNATAWSDGNRHRQWLEDAGEHWIRIQIERTTVAPFTYNVYVWLDDTPNATFLNVDLVNGAQMAHSLSGADYYEHSQVTLPAADNTKFNYFRFGWTFGFGNTGAAQTISLSSFGMNATR